MSSGGQLADDLLERRRPERAGLLAGRVDVVGERDPLRVAGDQRHLLGRERRAEARDDVLEAGLVRHQRVRVALDDDGLAGLADRRLGAVDEVQRAALVEQRGRRRVEVLGAAVDAVLAPSLPRIRPPRPTGWPFASRIGKITRSRKRSYTPPPRWRGLARPTSSSSCGVTWRFVASWRTSWSQPPGAQPSWCFAMVSSVKPRPRR